MKFTYLLVNFFSVIVPFAFSFHPKIKFNKHFSAFIKANVIAAIIFLVWDVIFTSKGIWSFNPDYVLGLNIFNLPLEEILFFICIPFACLFTYHCSTIFLRAKWNSTFEKYFLGILSFMLLITGIIFWHKAYTATTFISLSIFLFVLKYYFKVSWLQQFFTIYPLLLIPFFIVNGILTGTGLEHPVVLYNDSENLGIRLLTIPVEDIFYGMELLLLNIFFNEKFKRRN